MVDATIPNPTVLPDDDQAVQFSLYTTSLCPPPDDVREMVRSLHLPPDRGKDSTYHSVWLEAGGATQKIIGHPHLARTTLVFCSLFFAPILAMDFPHEVSPPRAELWPN